MMVRGLPVVTAGLSSWRGWRRRMPRLLLLAVVAALGMTGVLATAAGSGWLWGLPQGFPEPRLPTGMARSEQKVELGRHLFYDPRLSGNGTLSCASCHQQALAFSDGRRVSVGMTGEAHPRNAQGLANVAYHPSLTWANPALTTLEQQMAVPLFGTEPVEMGVNDENKAQVLARLEAEPLYADLFAQAYPDEGAGAAGITWGRIIQAIAAFQRTLLSGNSRYDQYLRGEQALTAQEERGLELFFGEKAECFHCHGSFNFNNQLVHAKSRLVEMPFHNTGLYNIGGTGAFPEGNRGVFELTQNSEDMGAFRAPSLRNVEVTAPYMHDGSMDTLDEVLAFYAAGGRNIRSGPHAGDGRATPYKDDFINRIDLNQQEQADLVAFLKTLTDTEFLRNPQLADPFVPAQ